MSVIQVHQEAGVALVTLNRPDAHNALNRELSEAIIATFADLAADEGVRAIVLTGAKASPWANSSLHHSRNHLKMG